MTIKRPFNFHKWIDEHRHLLKPPVGNQCVYDAEDFIVMVVGGPNSRKDYHWDEGEEFFYQLEGDIIVKIQEDGKAVDVPIREGEMFLLPPHVPHNPIRGANTIGMVIERKHDRHIAARQTNRGLQGNSPGGEIGGEQRMAGGKGCLRTKIEKRDLLAQQQRAPHVRGR